MPSAHADVERHLRALREADLAFHWRGMPFDRTNVRLADFPTYEWNLLKRSLPTPTLIVRDSALQHNMALMAEFCAVHGVLHAPHAKTPMSPQLAWMLLQSGSWATSVATVDQARVMRDFGFRRLLLANQVVDPQEVRWIASALDDNPGLEFWCLVDSVAGVQAMQAALHGRTSGRPIPVLIEVGIAGGRAGCRTLSEVEQTAAAIARSDGLSLVGVELYEAMAAKGYTLDEKLRDVDAALRFAADSFHMLRARDLLDRGPLLLSAGGSLYFDRVVEAFGSFVGQADVSVVLRGGCVVTHEVGSNDAISPLSGRSSDGRRLKQALELWATVTSLPEPGLAVLNFGKRDAPFDKGNPVAFAASPHPGAFMKLAAALPIRSINDHHTVVQVEDAPWMSIGNLVGFHITHACTAFDKWRLVPVVDDKYAVIDGLITYF